MFSLFFLQFPLNVLLEVPLCEELNSFTQQIHKKIIKSPVFINVRL